MSCQGTYEYVYNDNLLQAIGTFLTAHGLQIDVTRRVGENISLQKRAELSKGKKLFVSIHHDSAQAKYIKTVNGHPVSDKVEGYSIFVSRKNPYFDQSLFYARVLGIMLYAHGLRPSTHHGEAIPGENRLLLDPFLGIYQYDDLIVLKNALAPAFLLEAAVIINPKDEQLARNPVFQQSIAESFDFLLRFVDADSRSGPRRIR